MQTLKTEFDHDQYHFTQVQRAGDVALFAKRKQKHKRTSPFYEVVIIQKHEPTTWPNGDVSPARESMPHKEDFGSFAWAFSDLTRATKRFLSLVQARTVTG